MKTNLIYYLLLTKNRLNLLILHTETSLSRFWFGLLGLGYASFMIFSEYASHPGSSYVLMFKIAPDWAWAVAFSVHGLSLLYGAIYGKYSNFLLILEGVLGVAVWSAAAAATTLEQGAPGGTTVGALIALWVLIRYPTHSEWERIKCH